MEKEIKEIQDKLDALKLKYEQSKQPFKDGDVVEHCMGAVVKIVNYKEGKGYGLNNGIWGIRDCWSFKNSPHDWQLSTPKKWLEVCTKEAEKRGLVKKCTIDFGKFRHILTDDNYYVSEQGLFCDGMGYILMQNGIWATVLHKDKTLDELFEDYITDGSYLGYSDIPKHIKDNPEAYLKAIQNHIKALQNLKK